MNYTNGKVICKLGTLQPFWCNDITTKHNTSPKKTSPYGKLYQVQCPKCNSNHFFYRYRL